MRRATIWILILALVLLVLCLLWLLPRFVREEPLPPTSGIASSQSPLESRAPEAGKVGQAPPTAASPTEQRSIPREEAEEPAQRPGSISGRLLDSRRRAVAGATVLAASAPDPWIPVPRTEVWIARLPLDVADPVALGAEVPARATSDESGLFRLEGFEPGRVRLAVRSSRQAPYDRDDVRLASGQSLDLGDLYLEPASTVSGILEDDRGRPVLGVPIVPADTFADASIRPLRPSVGTTLAVTDRRGRFGSTPVRQGPWRCLAVGGPDLADAALGEDSPSAGLDLIVTLEEAVSLHGALVTRSQVPDGLVLRALPADPLPGPVPFHCRAEAREGKVMRNGAFRVDGLSSGVLYELRAGMPETPWEEASAWSPPAFAIASGDPVRVGWEADASVALELEGPCEVALEGAWPLRRALEGHTVSLDGIRPLLPFHGARLRVSRRGFRPDGWEIELRPGTATALGALKLDRLPVLTVRAVDLKSGAPLPDAIVTATELATGLDACGLPPLGAAADASGEARVASYAGAGSEVEVRARGFAPARARGPFGGGFTQPRLEMRLVRGATVRVRIVDDGGSPVPGARVEWIEGDWSPNEVAPPETADARTSRIADADGRTSFLHVPPGRHAFRLRQGSAYRDRAWTQREVHDGQELEIELQGRALASLAVRISDAGTPLRGAPATLFPAPRGASLLELAEAETPLPPGFDAHLDPAGAWTFRDLDAGEYVLAFGIPGQRLRGCRRIVLREGSNVFTSDLSVTAVSGRVAGCDGNPAARAELFVVGTWREKILRDAARGRAFRDLEAAELLALGVERRAATADAQGEFRLLGLPDTESFSILARTDLEGVGRSESVSGPADVTIHLAPAGALEILATTRTIPVACILIATPRERDRLPRIRAMLPGRTEILGALEPGAWEIELVTGVSRGRNRRSVEVAARDTRSVDLSLP